ncbi:MAG: ASCH domain-containing protein [Firmicutes bacterium]|nr:ASCH domain-containing protein [Bacillota bacterium]
MKVLTIKEPFATLIKNGVKKIETRSWKTKYRGELYIQASIASIDKKIYERKELVKLIGNLEMGNGYILCKCNLVDCIEMTEDFINEIKSNNHQEYICGRYEVGRYAWILDNIEVLDKPIKVKGQLGIWNYEK